MTKTFLTAASIIALTAAAAAPSYAQNNMQYGQSTNMSASLDANIVGDNDGDTDYPNRDTITVSQQTTAAGMIGENIYNRDGEAVATIEDIIIGSDGEAQMLVLSDGEWTGMGKMIALDFAEVTRPNGQGDIVAPITEQQIDRANSFVYSRAAGNEMNVDVMPRTSYSVARIMDSYLTDTRNESLADVNNLTFKNGRADKIIVDVDENLGLTGHSVAMDFDSLRMTQTADNEVRFQLSASQAQQFRDLKQSL